jgi:PAS domain S-box-containing protein
MTGNPSRVLIVEDEYYLGKMLEKALIHEEIEAIAVTDVDSAIKEIGKQSFDLIVSDIYMPGRNGKDLFEYVKDQDVEIPFIFMTGNPDLKMAIDFLTSGGYDYIVKPFMIADFIQKVKPVIQNHKIKKQEKNLVKDLRALLSRRLSELKIYQDVFDSTDDGEIITDVDGVIVKVNRGFEKITGFCNEELLQQSIDLLQKSILPDLKFKEILKKLKKENTWHGELKGKKKNNESWVVNITFSPIRNEEAQVFAYAGIFKDVTSQREVEQALISSLQQMNQAQEAIIFGMARLAEHRDNDTGFHLERIRNYCKLLAEALVEHEMYPDIIDSDFIQMLYRTAPLHDIGKVGIPDYILLKSDTLTEYEFDIMKSHTLIGFNTLNSILKIYGDLPFLQMGIEIAYCHHERWDGSGYPQGLKKDAIPLSAQILSIVDVYDALTTERTYKKAYAHSAALASIKKERGKHFSPKILDIFVEIADDINKIRESFTEMDDIIIPPQIQTEIKNILYKT